MNVCFEFGALFHSAIRWEKQGGKFKINIHLNSVESFLYCLCSSPYWKQRFLTILNVDSGWKYLKQLPHYSLRLHFPRLMKVLKAGRKWRHDWKVPLSLPYPLWNFLKIHLEHLATRCKKSNRKLVKSILFGRNLE